jgi:hypothetical protein
MSDDIPTSPMPWWQRITLTTLLAGIVCFFFWTVSSGPFSIKFGREQTDYYNTLTHGFIQGHLYMNEVVPEAMTKLADPYDPAQNQGIGLHDGSYYKGHYYLYFGVTPVLVLFLPYHLLAGSDFPPELATIVFCSVGLLAVTMLLVAVRRRYYPHVGFGLLVLGVLVAGLGGYTLALVRRPSFWEIPISAGYCFVTLMLGLIYRALHSARPWGWLAAAGLCFGLAVGARPTYAPAGVALMIPLVVPWWESRQQGKWRWWPGSRWWRQALALGVPVVLCALGLAWYNYQRFGNPLEFGLRYQLTGIDHRTARLFSTGFFAFNFRVYFLQPAQWSRYFPFIKVIRSLPVPKGYYGIEYVYGILTTLPASWLALVPLAFVLRRTGSRWSRYDAFVVMSALFAGITAGLLLFFNTAAARYMADFTPPILLLGVLGAFALSHELEDTPVFGRKAGRTLLGVVLGFTTLFGVLASLQLHGLLKAGRPDLYARLSRVCNQPAYWFERLVGTRHGPLEIKLRFPKDRTGKLEPLVVTGWSYEADYIFLYYTDARRLQVGFDHTSHGVVFSQPLMVDYDAEHTVVVDMGSLYPPETHPMFGHGTAGGADVTRKQRYDVLLDGVTMLEGKSEFYDSSPRHIGIGWNPVSEAYGTRFTGQIVRMRRLPKISDAEPVTVSPGSIRIHLALVQKHPPGGDPLLISGRPGHGNALFIEYLDGSHIRFGYDHWGVRSYYSEPVELDFSQWHVIEVNTEALYAVPDSTNLPPRNTPFKLWLDQRLVWEATLPFYPCTAVSVAVGRNPIGSSVCQPSFSGTILGVNHPAR